MQFRSIAISSISATVVASSSAEPWRADLDWAGDLESKLSPSASLLDVTFSDFATECHPTFVDGPYPDRTNHDLIDQPSGLCVSQLFCAYERCWPRPDAHGSNSTQATRDADEGYGGLFAASFDDLSPEVKGWLSDPANPSLNLPSKVLFPNVASDVVAAIEFAKENGLEVSVKNSGHSFTGASTKKGTLHLNMNRFVRYASSGIVNCDAAGLAEHQQCKLAVARNKPGFVRVGGGENWDRVYRAVDAVNAEEGNKYHAVGGAAGTVSPMGWTFQGGLAGTQGGRKYGLGVDQVIQIEMVLPNGQHVRFAPVEWEDASADGFIVPKTTSVVGECRSNPREVDESLWEWSDCPEDANVDFDDLWYAVNGGGGGTWGVVTSIYLQLHDYLPPRLFGIDGATEIAPIDLGVSKCAPEVRAAMGIFFESFRLRWVLAPGTLNVTQDLSDACGMADAGMSVLVCYGDEAYETLVDTWESFANDYYDPSVYNNVSLDDALACPGTLEGTWSDTMKYPSGPYEGQVGDMPLPTIPSESSNGVVNVLYPKSYIDENFEALMSNPEFLYFGGNRYLAFGSGTVSASDQANSLSAAHRSAAFKALVPAEYFYNSEFANMFDMSDADSFPSFQGANHVGNNYMGPLREDWTKACPTDLTQKERAERCVSIQETLWGTETLARLERIKNIIDPNYMFDCEGCVGNNRVRKETGTNYNVDDKGSNSTDSTETNGEASISAEPKETNENTDSSAGSIACNGRAVMLLLSVCILVTF